MFGIDGVLLALIITFIILFGAILSGFPVAFAIGGAGVISFALIALLDTAGLLIRATDCCQQIRDVAFTAKCITNCAL